MMNEKNNVEWSRLRADCSVLTDQHCQDNGMLIGPQNYGCCCYTVVCVYFGLSGCFPDFFFIMVANVLMPIGLCLNHTIFNAETCPGYRKKCTASPVNLFTIELYGFAAAVLVCSLYIFLFLTGLVIGTAWMTF